MATIEATKYTHRYMARLVIEAVTPLTVGSGEKNILTDAIVANDVNGLPYIPATAIAGVVRNMVKDEHIDEYFGFQKGRNGKGSEVIFSEAKIINAEGKVVDGLDAEAKKDKFLRAFSPLNLPIRQHARIGHKGVTEDGGKFDEHVVYAGSRFCFEIEMVSGGENYGTFENVVSQLYNKTFRIGGGTRKGFGAIKVIELLTRALDLRKKEDKDLYLEKSSSLAVSGQWKGWTSVATREEKEGEGWIKYEMTIKPEDFFFMGSGMGDNDVDMRPVYEKKVHWDSNIGYLSNDYILIPATSIKGALAHRVAYHYNKLSGTFADKLCKEEVKNAVGSNNEAVLALFGSEGNDNKEQVRGKVLLSDVFEKKEEYKEQIFHHVALDRFTSGAMNGALFQEKAIYGEGKEYGLTLHVEKKAFERENIQEAFEAALIDICKGLLPLGGSVNRGNGAFTGSLSRTQEGKEEKLYPNK